MSRNGCELQGCTDYRDGVCHYDSETCKYREEGDTIDALRDELAQLQAELAEARAYADKLAAGLPDGMLPKDVEVLRQANADMATELAEARKERDGARACAMNAMKQRDSLRDVIHELEQYTEHDNSCIWSKWQAGRTTEKGYEMKYDGDWYREDPKCECGLDDVIATIDAAMEGCAE